MQKTWVFSQLRIVYDEAKQFGVIGQVGYCCIIQNLFFDVLTNSLKRIFFDVFKFVVDVSQQSKRA